MLHYKKTKKQKPNYNPINPRLLNINTILKLNNQVKNVNLYENMNEKNINDITHINNIFNNNLNVNNGNFVNSYKKNIPTNYKNNYNIVKYLGEGIQGSLYLANDNNKKRYICKRINLHNNTNNNTNQIRQLELELNILKYLSSNKITKEYINPCLEYKIFDNQVFTIFPIFNGYSLNNLTNYLRKLDSNAYYEIVFHLIKSILYGLAKIHQSKIAHQNINNNSILVSTYKNSKEIFVKFTDFGLGCGNKTNIEDIPDAMININKYRNVTDESNKFNKSIFKYNSCRKHNYSPVTITDDIMEDLTDSEHLFISQKYDLLCLGFIFIKLLLYFENIDVNLQNGYSNKNQMEILEMVNNKYLSKINQNDKTKNQYKTLFPFLNAEYEVLGDIIEYLKLFKEFILCKTENRKTCQYVLDKLIIYEKYKDEEF